MSKNYDKLFIDVAKRVAEESNCIKYQVGCVFVRDNRVISMGYNGTTAGFINCDEKFEGDLKQKNVTLRNIRRIHHEWSMNFEVHAEMNCLMYACKNGIKTEGTTLYVTHTPCMNCLKHIIQAGIKTIVYDKEYKSISFDSKDIEDFDKLLKHSGIKLIKYYENNK